MAVERNLHAKENRRGRSPSGESVDIPFLCLILVLLTVGLVMLYSASSAQSQYDTGYTVSTKYLQKQGLCAVIGLVAMYMFSRIPTGVWYRLAWPLYGVSIALLLSVLVIGQEVTINDWYTGMVYTGKIESLGDYPSAEGYWNGMGNPTASYYPFRVFVEESADLQSGSYVSIIFSAGNAEQGVYLENPFIRTENGRSYVWVRGEDGLLEQRFVTTGKSLWGSYTQILEGLGEEDYVAFPYGKNLKAGAETVESDISALYE